MTRRDALINDLVGRLRCYTDAGLEGLLAREPGVCRLCGSKARRRDSWMEEDGSAFVRLQCTRGGCPWTRTIPDPTPPPGPRSPRVRGDRRKNVRIH